MSTTSQPPKPAMFTELIGERILLRPWRPEDADALWSAVDSSRAHLAPWMPWVAEYRSPADAVAFIDFAIAEWQAQRNYFIAVVECNTGRIVGGSGYNGPDFSAGCYEIGYWLRSDATGQGYATEATRLLTEHAFQACAANRVEIRCDPANRPSLAIAERLGFQLEGHLRANILSVDGQPRDTLVYGLIRADLRPHG